MPSLPPPVPEGLREMLKDYPGHLRVIQNDLNDVIEKPSKVTPPLELAIWALEGCLETFISEARSELKIAEEIGDLHAIARATEKLSLMLDCRSPTSWKDDNLVNYFGLPWRGRHGQ